MYSEEELKSYNNSILNMDCLDFMKKSPDNYFDLICCDPPYGIGIDGQKQQFCKNPKHNRKKHNKKEWDKSIPSKDYFKEIFRISKNQIIFGANYFNEYLEQGHKGWIIWDKGQHGLTMSDCEIIYSSFNCPTRVIVINRCELIKDFTQHPTQKPVKLISKILERHSKEDDIILDCFSGSGTTAIACHNLNRNFICIEKDPDYHKASVQRLKAVQAQLKLF